MAHIAGDGTNSAGHVTSSRAYKSRTSKKADDIRRRAGSRTSAAIGVDASAYLTGLPDVDRREFFTKGLRDLYKEAAQTAFGGAVDKQLQGLSNFLDPRGLENEPRPAQTEGPEEVYCRPPGAVSDPQQFAKLCTSCGDCIIACPHGTLFSPGKEMGPLLAPNYSACHLCEDYPCISACETGALVSLGGDLPGFGRAILREAGCLNYSNPKKTCRVCEKECPVEDTVSFNKDRLPTFADSCTGCGLCRAACPGEGDTIRIV